MHNGRIAYVGAMPETRLPGVLYVPVLDIEYNNLRDLPALTGNVVIMSKRGVSSLRMSGVRVGDGDFLCIGDKTALVLRSEYGIDSSYPVNMNSKGLLDLILKKGWRKMTLVGSDRTSPWFLKKLEENGIIVSYIRAYSIKPSKTLVSSEELSGVGSLFFGSSLSFNYFVRVYGRSALHEKKVFAIGENTSETMKKSGVNPDRIEENPDINRFLSQWESES